MIIIIAIIMNCSFTAERHMTPAPVHTLSDMLINPLMDASTCRTSSVRNRRAFVFRHFAERSRARNL